MWGWGLQQWRMEDLFASIKLIRLVKGVKKKTRLLPASPLTYCLFLKQKKEVISKYLQKKERCPNTFDGD